MVVVYYGFITITRFLIYSSFSGRKKPETFEKILAEYYIFHGKYIFAVCRRNVKKEFER